MARAAAICRGVFLSLMGGTFVAGQASVALAKASHYTDISSHRPAAAVRTRSTGMAHPIHTRTALHATHPDRPAGGASARPKRPVVEAQRAGHVAAGRHGQVTVAGRHGRISAARHDSDAMLPLVVIDPGHGGRDPGAIGRAGTQEKDVTLAIALQLRQALAATKRYRIAMTRSADRTVPLSERLAFARQHDADLLIAIHADASPDRSARGASVYVSGGQGVSHMAASSGNSAQIAQALTATAPHPEASSAWLQYSMIEQLSDDVRMVDSPARAEHLYVLASHSIPSVLLETGFITNRQDEALLKQTAHQRRLVDAIKDAINDYFRGLASGGSRT